MEPLVFLVHSIKCFYHEPKQHHRVATDAHRCRRVRPEAVDRISQDDRREEREALCDRQEEETADENVALTAEIREERAETADAASLSRAEAGVNYRTLSRRGNARQCAGSERRGRGQLARAVDRARRA